jgi:hypothetical protein
MATTVGARIKFDADSRDAVRAMSRLERAAEGTRQSLGRIGDVAGGAALGVAGLGTVEEALTRVVDGLTESVRAYAAADSDVGEQVAGTAEQFRGLQESIGAAVIGGENANLIFGATQQIIGELSRIVADNETAIRSLTINAFAGFLDVTVAGVRFVNGLVDVFEVAKLATKGLALGVTELGIALANGLLIPVEAASLAIANMVSDLTDALRTAHQVAVGLGRDGMAGELEGVIVRLDSFGEGARRFSNSTAQMRSELIDTRDALREGFARDVEDTVARIDRRSQAVDDFASSIGGIADAIRDASTVFPVFRAQVESTGESTAAEVEQITASMQDLIALADTLRTFGADVRTSSLDRLKAENAIEQQGQQKLLDAEIEAQQRAADKIKAAYNARVEAAQDFTAAMSSSFAAVVSGQQSALDAIKGFLGQELIARGTRYALEATALAFVPGLQGQAAGLGVAAAAMIAGGAALSGQAGGAGGGGGGAASSGLATATPEPAQTITQTTTIQSNFGIVGDQRQAARLVADSVRTAQREGYLR